MQIEIDQLKKDYQDTNALIQDFAASKLLEASKRIHAKRIMYGRTKTFEPTNGKTIV